MCGSPSMISRAGLEPGVDRVYLATGAAFPDALAGGYPGDSGPARGVSQMANHQAELVLDLMDDHR